jgi:protein-S-isoprenylcysteine O-methyltransferase Ste14
MTLSPKLAVFSVLSVLMYLGLAIAGFGGFAAFFAQPALVTVAVVTLLLMGAAFFTEGNLSKGEREDRANRWVLPAFGVLGLLSAYLPAYTDARDIWTIDGATLRWIGVALFTVGGVLRLWPVFVLGRRFTGLVAIQPGHTLVTDGIYKVIRHPSYLGLLAGSFGWALTFRSGIGLVLAALMIVPTIGRIRAEEALLREQFGEDYDRFSARTSRLIPGIY